MDEHLDTSWCPVCERLILPKRYTVPVAPVAPPVPPQPIRASSPAPSALRASQTTRGKNGTIKARPNAHGGGLLHGTGRVRPGGGLRRDNTVKLNKSPSKVAQLLPEPQLPPAPVKTRTVIDQSQTPLYCSEECRSQDHHLDMSELPMDYYHHEDRPFSPHPAFLNPASRSPPPASPTLPPVPPNSWSARLSDAEQSDSSSATSTSYGTSSHGQPSPTDEPPRPRVERQDSWDFSSHPIPPPIPPMPLHPHRPQAAVDPLRHCKPKVEKENGGYNGGIMMAARRLASLLHPPRESTELSPPSIPSIFGFGAAPKPKVDVTSKKQKRNSAPAAPFDWQALVYNYGTPSGERPSFGSPSRESNVVKEEPAPPPRRPSPSRAQSVAELYAKYPLRTSLSRPTPSRSNSLASLPTTSTSYDTSYASTTQARSLERENIRSPTFSTGSEPSERRRRRHEPRSLLPPGAEGKLLVPDVKLKRFSASSPTQPPPRPLSTASFAESASAYSGTSSRSRISLSRNQSEASIARSQLGSVREEESDASTARHRRRRDRRSMISTEECNGPSSFPERRRLGMESRTWSYDNVAMPTYPVMPAIPVRQIRHAKVFVADGEDVSLVISQRPLNADERDRKDTEVSRKRGEEGGKEGWWVNLESEVMVIPERKRLFLFAGK
ncbi:hypothetical protein BD410DRAFT_616776 [Rickenella mellea]|uniref:Uncharacterized protein n=1 Tax=Rickenella mellea TaxID=50990 RepID=A0A4Y7PPW4_9AGAM|nr:hypothetical protein BD410DRAFT_616776 [Rickenella mellea]